jgi:gluconolactonase
MHRDDQLVLLILLHQHLLMNRLFFLSLNAALFMYTSCNESAKPGYGQVERIDPRLDEVISTDAKVEIIAEGFEWSEGPLWVEKEKMLLFSDIPKNTIYKWTEENGKEVYLTPSGYTGTAKRGGETGSNGLLLNRQGQLVLCQHGDRRIAVMNAPVNDPKPDFKTLASGYNGKKFDSPNDAIIRSNGDIFFTDPPYGLEKNAADPAKEAPWQGVYKWSSADGTVTLLTDTITRPNGIAFLPGERSLVIASSDSLKAIWYRYDLDENDSLINGSILYDATAEARKDPGLPDGLKVNEKGYIFATGPGGVWIFGPDEKLLGKIRLNGVSSNCAIAGNTLYITADNYLLRVKLK